MITQVGVVGIHVGDQDRAVDFYVNTLGFELRRDTPLDEDFRWIEVAPPGAETVLVQYTPPGLEDRIGTWSGVVFDCEDIKATYQDLSQKGVVFSEEPEMQPWGMMQAQFRDLDGNTFVLVQRDGSPLANTTS